MWSSSMQLLKSIFTVFLELGAFLCEFECGDFTIS